MKAPSFAYAKPRSLEEVFVVLRRTDDAKLLAGGQTLLATLNMRLSSPAVLVDITGVPGLAGIAVRGNVLRIGALTRHREIERSREVAEHAPLLAQAAPHIAHVAIRNVGTIGGSLAHADPAAEWPACCVALDADIVLASRSGERRVKAREFFKGLFETALGDGRTDRRRRVSAARAGVPERVPRACRGGTATTHRRRRGGREAGGRCACRTCGSRSSARE